MTTARQLQRREHLKPKGRLKVVKGRNQYPAPTLKIPPTLKVPIPILILSVVALTVGIIVSGRS
jgi:hypothetical protein